MSSMHTRRSFMSVVGALAGAATARVSAGDAAAQATAPSNPGWDLSWMDAFRGAHKQVFDMGGLDPANDPGPMRFVRNYLNTINDVYALEYPDVNTAVGISGVAFPVNASDRLWQEYALGERSQIIDPMTMKPAVRNIFLDGSPTSVTALQARGTLFWQCNIALGGVARRLAQARGLPAEDVRADLIAGLNPGVRIVPSNVMALGLMQERGFTYVRL